MKELDEQTPVEIPDDQLENVVGGTDDGIGNPRTLDINNGVHVENGISVGIYKDGRLL